MKKLKKYRVWHIPQIPGKPFHFLCSTLKESKTVLRALAKYDLFQLANKIKPDFNNAQGLEVFDKKEGTWREWENDEGDDIATVLRGGRLP